MSGAVHASVWTATTMVEAVRIIGAAVREVHHRDAQALNEFGVEFNAKFIFGGQIKGEGMRLFHIYSAGNFIETSQENCSFQIGESKYGKPIIDRVVEPSTPLDEAAKCALISMDSTLRSNISVGMPLDLLVYEGDTFRVTKFVHIDSSNQYMKMIRDTWGARLKQVFGEIPDPTWLDSYVAPGAPRLETEATQPVRAPLPSAIDSEPVSPVQLVARAGQAKTRALARVS